jgi:hypothetical protein
MSNEVAILSASQLVETVLIKGDLSKLTVEERNSYYRRVCESTGLNPLTRPLEYIPLGGKLVLYARKDATDQLRTIHKISVDELTTAERDGVFVVTVKVRNSEGRTDMATGAVPIANLKGEALANAMMKAETKSKRRATLSIAGLGLLDETELETIPELKKLRPPPTPSRPIPKHDPETGEIHDSLPEHSAPPPVPPSEAGAPMPNRTDGDGAPAEDFKEADQYEIRWLMEIKGAVDWRELAKKWNADKDRRNAMLWRDETQRKRLNDDMVEAIEFLKNGGGL